MGRPKKIKVEEPFKVNQDNALEVVEETKKALEVEEEPKKEVVVPSGEGCVVKLKDGTTRYYSRSKDGKMWKVLAKNYAEHTGGKIV